MYKPPKCVKGITMQNYRKTIGKPWDNCGNHKKSIGKHWANYGKQ